MASLMLLVILAFGSNLQTICAKCLLREPPDIVTAPQQSDAGFYVDVSGDPKFYEPGHIYTVSLRVSAFPEL